MNVLEQARYGIDSYKEWLKAEGLRVVEGLAIDCTEVETAEWPATADGSRCAATSTRFGELVPKLGVVPAMAT